MLHDRPRPDQVESVVDPHCDLGKIAHKCKPLTGQWFVVAGDVPKGVKSLQTGFNLPFITVLLKVIDWSDKGLCASLILGFRLYGDLRVVKGR